MLFLDQPVQVPVLPVPHPLIKLVKERKPVVPNQSVFSCLLRALVTHRSSHCPKAAPGFSQRSHETEPPALVYAAL